MTEHPSPDTIIHATKTGATISLNPDPHPDTTKYLAVNAPGMLILFPKDGVALRQLPSPQRPSTSDERHDQDEILRNAMSVLAGRVDQTEWTRSLSPFSDLIDMFNQLISQHNVRSNIETFLNENNAVENAVQMLFASISMSARADWRSAPPEAQGVAARGWFLGRWVPTFLVLDGPILRFLSGSAFRDQQPQVPRLRAVRRFFETHHFKMLRNGFAHWSFRWESAENDSVIVATHENIETARASRAEVDAFHITTFALIDAMHQAVIAPTRKF